MTATDEGYEMLVQSIATRLGQSPESVRSDLDIEAKRLHASKLDVARRVSQGLQKPEKPVEKPAATPAVPAPATPAIVPLNQMQDDEIDAVLEQHSIIESTPTEATIVSVNQAAAMRVTFDEIKRKVLRQGDIHTIQTKEGKRSYIKKSGWRIIATVFNITDAIISKECVKDGNNITWIFEVKASAPNGRSATGIASCSTDERKFSKSSDVMATAHTRAKNRAISDLVGAGEVSAEEVGE